MGLRSWTRVVGTVVQTYAGRYSGGFEWMVDNSDLDRTTNNRSYLRIRMWIRIDQTSWQTSYGAYNLTGRTSWIQVDGSTYNQTTSYDFRQPNLTYYYVGTDFGVFPQGSEWAQNINHNPDGTKQVNINTFFNGNSSTNYTSTSTSATITLPSITVQTYPAPNTISFTQPIYGKTSECSWASVASAINYILEYNINSTGWNQETITSNTSYIIPSDRFIAIGATIQYRVKVQAAQGWNESLYTYSSVQTIMRNGIYFNSASINKIYIGSSEIKEVLNNENSIWKK